MSTYHSRRPSRAVTTASAVALGIGLALAAPLAASAHVGVSPEEVTADESAVLTFSFTHGCDGSPTTALRITMPSGLTSVSPTASAEWGVEIERGADGLLSAVTYTATTPVANELRGEVSLAVRAGAEVAGTLAFPVEQTCIDGSTAWTELVAEGEDPHSVDAPAPTIMVHEADQAEHGQQEASSAEHADTAPAEDGSNLLVTLLSGGGLLAGVAALIVAVFAIRRAG